MRPRASSLPPLLSVAPGDEVTAELTVRNVGEVVDEFRIEVAGAAAPWTEVTPASVRLYPGDQGKAVVRFRPPRLPTTPAGDITVTLSVVSMEDPGQPLVQSSTLRVAGYKSLTASVAPVTSSAGQSAVHDITVDNQGNVPAHAAISAGDPDQKLQISVLPPVLVVANGGRATARLTVASRKRPLRGHPKTHAFRIVLTEEGTPPITLDAAVEQAPVLPGCLARFFFLILLVLALIGLAVVLGIVALAS